MDVAVQHGGRAYHDRYLRRVRLIPNPVTGKPSPPTQREKLVIAVGHLEPLKNFEHAIRAMAASRLEEDGWSLAIIGSGSSEDRLRQLIEEVGLRRTEIHDPVDDLSSWYARASLLLVTSRLESFSLVLAEAMASGVIPIAYASDGPSFILESFPDHLVPMGNVDALSQRMTKFASKAEMEPLREEMRRSIEDRFSSEVIARQWQELLETCDQGRAC